MTDARGPPLSSAGQPQPETDSATHPHQILEKVRSTSPEIGRKWVGTKHPLPATVSLVRLLASHSFMWNLDPILVYLFVAWWVATPLFYGVHRITHPYSTVRLGNLLLLWLSGPVSIPVLVAFFLLVVAWDRRSRWPLTLVVLVRPEGLVLQRRFGWVISRIPWIDVLVWRVHEEPILQHAIVLSSGREILVPHESVARVGLQEIADHVPVEIVRNAAQPGFLG